MDIEFHPRSGPLTYERDGTQRRILSTRVPLTVKRAVLAAAVEREVTVQVWVEEAVREALAAVGVGDVGGDGDESQP